MVLGIYPSCPPENKETESFIEKIKQNLETKKILFLEKGQYTVKHFENLSKVLSVALFFFGAGLTALTGFYPMPSWTPLCVIGGSVILILVQFALSYQAEARTKKAIAQQETLNLIESEGLSIQSEAYLLPLNQSKTSSQESNQPLERDINRVINRNHLMGGIPYQSIVAAQTAFMEDPTCQAQWKRLKKQAVRMNSGSPESLNRKREQLIAQASLLSTPVAKIFDLELQYKADKNQELFQRLENAIGCYKRVKKNALSSISLCHRAKELYEGGNEGESQIGQLEAELERLDKAAAYLEKVTELQKHELQSLLIDHKDMALLKEAAGYLLLKRHLWQIYQWAKEYASENTSKRKKEVLSGSLIFKHILKRLNETKKGLERFSHLSLVLDWANKAPKTDAEKNEVGEWFKSCPFAIFENPPEALLLKTSFYLEQIPVSKEEESIWIEKIAIYWSWEARKLSQKVLSINKQIDTWVANCPKRRIETIEKLHKTAEAGQFFSKYRDKVTKSSIQFQAFSKMIEGRQVLNKKENKRLHKIESTARKIHSKCHFGSFFNQFSSFWKTRNLSQIRLTLPVFDNELLRNRRVKQLYIADRLKKLHQQVRWKQIFNKLSLAGQVWVATIVMFIASYYIGFSQWTSLALAGSSLTFYAIRYYISFREKKNLREMQAFRQEEKLVGNPIIDLDGSRDDLLARTPFKGLHEVGSTRSEFRLKSTNEVLPSKGSKRPAHLAEFKRLERLVDTLGLEANSLDAKFSTKTFSYEKKSFGSSSKVKESQSEKMIREIKREKTRMETICDHVANQYDNALRIYAVSMEKAKDNGMQEIYNTLESAHKKLSLEKENYLASEGEQLSEIAFQHLSVKRSKNFPHDLSPNVCNLTSLDGVWAWNFHCALSKIKEKLFDDFCTLKPKDFSNLRVSFDNATFLTESEKKQFKIILSNVSSPSRNEGSSISARSNYSTPFRSQDFVKRLLFEREEMVFKLNSILEEISRAKGDEKFSNIQWFKEKIEASFGQILNVDLKKKSIQALLSKVQKKEDLFEIREALVKEVNLIKSFLDILQIEVNQIELIEKAQSLLTNLETVITALICFPNTLDLVQISEYMKSTNYPFGACYAAYQIEKELSILKDEFHKNHIDLAILSKASNFLSRFSKAWESVYSNIKALKERSLLIEELKKKFLFFEAEEDRLKCLFSEGKKAKNPSPVLENLFTQLRKNSSSSYENLKKIEKNIIKQKKISRINEFKQLFKIIEQFNLLLLEKARAKREISQLESDVNQSFYLMQTNVSTLLGCHQFLMEHFYQLRDVQSVYSS